MAESTVVYTPDGGNNGFNNFNGWGGGILGFLLGLFFGIGWGGFGGNRPGAPGFLSNQIDNNQGRDLLLTALTSQGEASRTAIANLATTIGQDLSQVNNAVQVMQSSLSALAAQQAVSVPQIINAIQGGNSMLGAQLQQACCQNQMRIMEQTNQLGSQADRNANSILGAINAQTVAMNEQFCKVQNREYESRIQALQTELANAQRAADKSEIMSGVNRMLEPLAAQIAAIKAATPPTVAVPYPQLQAIPSFNTIELLTNIGLLNRFVQNTAGSGAEATKTNA